MIGTKEETEIISAQMLGCVAYELLTFIESLEHKAYGTPELICQQVRILELVQATRQVILEYLRVRLPLLSIDLVRMFSDYSLSTLAHSNFSGCVGRFEYPYDDDFNSLQNAYSGYAQAIFNASIVLRDGIADMGGCLRDEFEENYPLIFTGDYRAERADVQQLVELSTRVLNDMTLIELSLININLLG